MKVVVTGGAGFIGSHVTDALLAAGNEVHVVDNLVNGRKEDVPEGALLHEVDVLDTDALREIFKDADGVFHFAALPRVTYSYDYPEESHSANIDGTFSVLMAARDAGVRRVVYAGSSSSYGTQDTLPFTEDMQVRPVSLYAFQKFAGEEYARLFTENYGLETVTLRFFSVYGPRMRPDGGYALAIPKFLACRKEGKPLPITGDGSHTRDFTHVRDVVRACLSAMESSSVGGGEVINIAAGRNISVDALASLIGGEREYLDPRPGDAQDTYGDTARAQALLSWEPSITLEEGIEELKREWGIEV
ncbi:NAD-dependent epimerase/dehydratase family protein [Patescibacteria group bacterium]|nr:NAD-dependent epimerase/dehydratase family protein [Patescibacteria group bacterium]MBU2158692.1 NAD-dependent epimerase/dehydratase family protein [Patescibacteria group bacterium]